MIRSTTALVAAAALGLAACGSDDDSADESGTDDTAVEESADGTDEAPAADGLTIADPWSRQPAEGQTNSAVYGVLTNDTDGTVTAIAASTSVTADVELHETLMNDDGEMSMREKEGGYELAAGESLTFEPGGPHIMLLGIDPATYPEAVDVTLEFDDGSTIEFTAEVRAIDGGMDDMDHSDMEDGEMDEMDETDESPSTEG